LKQITDRLTALARRSPSSIGTRDSELEIRNAVNLIATLPNPTRNASPSLADIQSDSFLYNQSLQQGGIQALAFLLGPELAPGLWHLQGTMSVQFVGSTNPASRAALDLRDPAAVQHFLGAVFLFHSPIDLVFPINVLISVTEPGWKFRIFAPATVAGDNLYIQGNFNAAKLL